MELKKMHKRFKIHLWRMLRECLPWQDHIGQQCPTYLAGPMNLCTIYTMPSHSNCMERITTENFGVFLTPHHLLSSLTSYWVLHFSYLQLRKPLTSQISILYYIMVYILVRALILDFFEQVKEALWRAYQWKRGPWPLLGRREKQRVQTRDSRTSENCRRMDKDSNRCSMAEQRRMLYKSQPHA